MEDIFTKLLGRAPKFGDRFLTKDSRILIFHCFDFYSDSYNDYTEPFAHLIEEFTSGEIVVDNSGKCISMGTKSEQYDIIGIYEEPVSSEKITTLAKESLNHIQLFASAGHVAQMMRDDYIGGYYAGYVKAKSE